MFKWKDNFSCNVESIDNQHKKLFQLGSKMYSIHSLKDGFDHYDEIMEVLYELKEYTIYHFKYEENLLKENNYPDLEKHIKEHEKFIDKLISLESDDIDESQKKATMDIIIFISNWIENHILRTDKNYAQFLSSKGVN